MANDHNTFQHPLAGRYAAREMRELFGQQRRIGVWRRLWLALAESERELGLSQITEDALAQMRANLDNIDFDKAADYERQFRHDVMAHVHAFGDVAPAAKAIIHLGATSCYVTDNADLILMRDGLDLLLKRLRGMIAAFADFAKREADTACVGATHFQVAQLTTVGKRTALWLQDLVADYHELKRIRDQMPLRGVKGTTGTQASFLELFDGDADKVLELDRRVCKRMSFERAFDVTGQTYPRKYDYNLLCAVAGIGVSAQKLATDIRLLMGLGELDEPFEEKQIGSSAMAYKRNPMRSERVCAISRWLINLPANAATTAAEQWLERTLDDSANRRMSIPEAFLSADVILSLLHNIGSGLKANHAVIASRVRRELPLMATEAIIMAAVRAGGDRQQIHEQIRVHSHAAIARMKDGAADNDLLSRLKADPAFAKVKDTLDGLMDPARFVGMAPMQTRAYLQGAVAHALAEGESAGGDKLEV
ncbi:MAG: adenylosuccinate lyase [Planctomycetes bacterium]|nr:adenylosuccinate lyase [Planctomycetota bacterium]MCW8137125.1 adenylosuccinate lyase [Planctomycetota bacterium]